MGEEIGIIRKGNRYYCSECGYWSTFEIVLYRHMQRDHGHIGVHQYRKLRKEAEELAKKDKVEKLGKAEKKEKKNGKCCEKQKMRFLHQNVRDEKQAIAAGYYIVCENCKELY